MREALARVEQVKARKAREAAKKKATEEAAARKAAEEEERRNRGCNGQEPTGHFTQRNVSISSKAGRKGKGKAKMPAQPVGGNPDDGDKEDRAPCERCKNKKLPCQMQAGKRSSIICKSCHDAKQYLRQLLTRQEDDHAWLISMETRMAMMGMGEGLAMAGPSRRTTKQRRPLKRRRIMEESEEGEEEEEEEKEVGKEKEVEKDGEGEEEETAPTEA
ncbi:hypothetical protein F5879DRAFT_994356 [Lentinula edodes]|nr:hypothetical protein F5879DRAFT_994356 [Lentinula edodes]